MNRAKNDQAAPLLYRVLRHSLTDLTILGKRTKDGIVISGIWFGDTVPVSGARWEVSSDSRFFRYCGVLHRVLDGKAEDVSALPIDISHYTEFQKRIVVAARSIPRGTTVSYAELAKMAGMPRAVRAAASVMRNNKFPLIIPCHRVIKSDGTTGGFMGKRHGWQVGLKRRLLELERKQ